MALRTLRYENDELLRKSCREVKEITTNITNLLGDMKETLYSKNGVGLAAPQVGVLRRIVIIDVGDENGLIEFINPVIIESLGSQSKSEACLSLPGRAGLVERPETVKVKALDRNFNEFTIEGTGLLAIAMCHELDHLDGILYTDKMIKELTIDKDGCIIEDEEEEN